MLHRKPLDEEELHSLAQQRANAYIEQSQSSYGPAHIAVIHDRVAPLRFSAGIAAIEPITFTESSLDSTMYDLWDIGREAAKKMYQDNDNHLDEVQLLATVIVDSPTEPRVAYLNSPDVDYTILVKMTRERESKKTAIMTKPGRNLSFAVECGFRMGKHTIEIGEYVSWN